MEDFKIIQDLIGSDVTTEDLKYLDCYVHQNLGLFIPSTGACQYAIRQNHTHPTYMFVISFSQESMIVKPTIEIKENHYYALAVSPDISHEDPVKEFTHYYCILIRKEYFEEQFRLYTEQIPVFCWEQFLICHDILKTLNIFAFEYSKKMKNSDITLEAHAKIITHWLIRSILGESYDMRSVSSHYAVARAQQYIEQHYSENITVNQLAQLGSMSASSFNRIFKKETKLTPIEYVIEIRMQKAKKLLIRKEIPITEIAFRCGFGSSSHFCASFSKLCFVTPTEYRESYSSS